MEGPGGQASAIRNLRFKIQKVGSHSATPRKKKGKGMSCETELVLDIAMNDYRDHYTHNQAIT